VRWWRWNGAIRAAVLHRVPGSRLQVEAGRHAGREGSAEIAFDIDVLVEIALEQADVASRQRRQHAASL